MHGKSLALAVVSIFSLIAVAAFASSGILYAADNSSLTTIDVIPTFQSSSTPNYIIAGGQEGEWFTPGQYPELFKLSAISSSQTLAVPVTSSLKTVSGEGTVWSGGYNGTNWLISGWGSGKFLNPFISLYNETTTKTRLGNYTDIESNELEWAGGDVFAVGWNGTDWLLTGMGSGVLPPYSDSSTNHMSMAVLSENGTFTDLSAQIPNQQDLILYANAWNGKYWLVGGGWFGFSTGALYMLSGDTITDLTAKIEAAVPSFDSIQSIAWNGQYFLIGGVGFLAEYNGRTFTDLTPQLDYVLNPTHSLNYTSDNAVNAIAWMGGFWMLAGGSPVGYYGVGSHSAWVASLVQSSANKYTFSDLTSKVIPSNIAGESDSTLLTMSCSFTSGCAIGGSDSSGGVLFWYNGANSIDLSSTLNSNMTYVQWVGLDSS